jgi:sugar phosphate isomerase/epimerase
LKLSIHTGFHSACPNRERWTVLEAVRFLSEVGFEALDMNFCGSISKDTYLRQDNWKEYIEEIGRTVRECNIEVSQSHLPFYNFATPGCEDLEFRAEMVSRSIAASSMLGVKWAVFHSGNAPDAVLSVRESKRRTTEYLKPYLEQARSLGVGIALENLFIPEYLHSTHRYCSNVEELCDLADTLGDGVGICWDFGHANLIGDDQRECLRIVGDRLKVTHVHDNNGKHDDHAAPFMSCSNVNWEGILPVLHEIGYQGNFSLEVSSGRVPEELHRPYAEYLVKTGKYLISLINKGV